MYLTIDEVAAELKLKPSTIKRHIKNGLLPGCRLGGFNAPVRIERDELKRIMRGLQSMRNDMELFSGHNRNPSEQMRFDELNRRCTKLAETIGPKVVFDVLKEFGVERLGDLHPRYYEGFRGKLMCLSRLDTWEPPKKRVKERAAA